ncbi:hypothetical protein B0T16DRAFT_419869 [Cercophora newfieldiana]|uniref:Uncharacterized protein n=1 Tax=Cercophora newfieldiana TaxID=92897 RepID=A0AA40CK73_9PEZI|nr:hypothetical protein B0T16DRAFT_419869 [Cercophora newfieldiana]
MSRVLYTIKEWQRQRDRCRAAEEQAVRTARHPTPDDSDCDRDHSGLGDRNHNDNSDAAPQFHRSANPQPPIPHSRIRLPPAAAASSTNLQPFHKPHRVHSSCCPARVSCGSSDQNLAQGARTGPRREPV